MIQILPAGSGEPLEQFIALAHAYVTWMVAEIQHHYPELDIAAFTATRDYNDLRQKFPGNHVPPDGCLLIARADDHAVGCVALGRLTTQICELRTLFVQPASHGLGIGKQLVKVALLEAHHLRYTCVRLDTLGFMGSALTLYRALGFYAIEPYRTIPADLRHYLHFLEHRIAEQPPE